MGEIMPSPEEYAALRPLDHEMTGKGILRWLERRVAPKNRTFVRETLAALNL